MLRHVPAGVLRLRQRKRGGDHRCTGRRLSGRHRLGPGHCHRDLSDRRVERRAPESGGDGEHRRLVGFPETKSGTLYRSTMLRGVCRGRGALFHLRRRAANLRAGAPHRARPARQRGERDGLRRVLPEPRRPASDRRRARPHGASCRVWRRSHRHGAAAARHLLHHRRAQPSAAATAHGADHRTDRDAADLAARPADHGLLQSGARSGAAPVFRARRLGRGAVSGQWPRLADGVHPRPAARRRAGRRGV